MALLGQKLDTFIEEERQWRLSYNSRFDKLEDRMNYLRQDIQDLQVKRGAAEEENKSLWGALRDLKYSVRAWDAFNTISIVGSVITAVFVKR